MYEDQKGSENADDNVDLIPEGLVRGQDETHLEDKEALYEEVLQAGQIVCGLASENEALRPESQPWSKDV
jgi:hypothetical protein